MFHHLSRQPWCLKKKLLVDLFPLSSLLFLPTPHSPIKRSRASVPVGEMLLLLVGELSILLYRELHRKREAFQVRRCSESANRHKKNPYLNYLLSLAALPQQPENFKNTELFLGMREGPNFYF